METQTVGKIEEQNKIQSKLRKLHSILLELLLVAIAVIAIFLRLISLTLIVV